MPFELHADYDRDGRLTASASEYAKRNTSPGAILLPNLDRDGRALPKTVESGSPVELDCDRASSVAQDKEPVPIRVVVTAPDSAADCELFLRAEGALGEYIRVRDSKLRLLPIDPGGRKTDFILPMSGDSTDFFVESVTLGGTPRSNLPDDPNPRIVTVELYCRRNGRATRVDTGIFEVPPVRIIDDLAQAERLYIAEADTEENLPSIRDVERELKDTGVPVVIIPEEVNFKDVWVQDQFQLAFCDTPSGPLRLLIHCPRARANAYWVESSLNLASVIESHFASTDLGVFADLFSRHFLLRDAIGVQHAMSLLQSQHAYMEMGTVFRYRRMLIDLALFLAEKLKDASSTRKSVAHMTASPLIGIEEAHSQTGRLLTLVRDVVGNLKKQLDDDDAKERAKSAPDQKKLEESNDLRQQLDQLSDRAAAWRRRGDLAAPSPRPGVINIPLDTRARIDVPSEDADKLFDRLSAAHDSLTYGGNIECSPPFGEPPQARVVLGNGSSGGTLDADVLRFFLSQDQSIVELDSTWLHVGHIDEFMGFVPAPNESAGFVIARASPQIGAALIRTAKNLYLSGLPAGHDHVVFEDSPFRFQRVTNDGPHPVTMMLRGQQWLHLHPKEAFEPLEPPAIFKEFSLHSHFGLADPEWDKDNDRFTPGPLPENMRFSAGKRKYPARMSVLEWNFADDGSNEDIDDQVLRPLTKAIFEAFEDIRLLRIPVLLDKVPFVPEPDEHGKTLRNVNRTVKTFLPNCVNFQVVGDRILMPRPYAPRMRPADIQIVLKKVFIENEVHIVLPEMNERYFRSRGLLDSKVWLDSSKDWRLAGAPNVLNVAKLFRDGFAKDQTPEQIFKLIKKANPGAFRPDDQLRSGWHRLSIPDGTVDLFEAAIYVMLESVGAKPRFVDSWHYHVHGGQIHCGTNVLRKVRPAPKPDPNRLLKKNK